MKDGWIAAEMKETRRQLDAMSPWKRGVIERENSKMKTIAQIVVPPAVAPYMERHGQRATEAITAYLTSCPTVDEKLGALGVLAQVLLHMGDAIQAMQLAKTAGSEHWERGKAMDYKLKPDDFPLTALGNAVYRRTMSSPLATFSDEALAADVALRLNRDDQVYGETEAD